MNRNRIKKALPPDPPPRTREGAIALARKLTKLKLCEIETQAAMDKELADVRTRYEEQLATLADLTAQRLHALEQWADVHPEEFGKARSTDLIHGVCGHRMTPPAVKPIGKLTWKAITARIKAARWRRFLHVKETVDKDAILARAQRLGPTRLAKLGVEIKQVDEFYYAPKIEEVETTEKGAS